MDVVTTMTCTLSAKDISALSAATDTLDCILDYMVNEDKETLETDNNNPDFDIREIRDAVNLMEALIRVERFMLV